MSQLLRIILIVLLLVAAVLVWVEVREGREGLEGTEGQNEVRTTHTSLKGVELVVMSPTLDSVVSSPLTITGEAPGFWYFEATFPLTLVNWNGLIIAEGYATAQGEWMTQEMVPFIGTLEFTDVLPLTDELEDLTQVQDFMKNGRLILQRDNPSGLPENDDAVEFTVRFAQ